MSESIFSIAIMEPFEGLENEFVSLLNELYTYLEQKGYCQNTLLCNGENPPLYINTRRWTSPEARWEAQQDPEVQHCWARLGHLCHMRRVYETLGEVDWKKVKPCSKRQAAEE